MIGWTLYKKDGRGKMRQWSCEIDYTSECLVISHGTVDGELQEKEEYIEEGKAGRDIDEQLELKANSRINKKLDQGYVTSIDDAKGPATNTLGFLRPMTAKALMDKNLKFKNSILNSINWNTAFVQRKYDGHRCLVVHTEEEGLVAYSRGGKRIKSIEHILEGMDIPVNATLDGELYCHGEPLQRISSWVRRKQENTKRLHYVVYDMICDMPFYQRWFMLQGMNLGENAVIAETFGVCNINEAMKLFGKFKEDGYEGAMLRHGACDYEHGKRSSSLIKIKSWLENEFVVHDISASRDGWARLHMKSKNGIEFKASAPGTIKDREYALYDKDEYIGMSVTIRYAGLTDEGVPFQPVAVAWRNLDES